jgi:RecB family exonuclease
VGVREGAGGLESIVREPAAKTRTYVTPSGAASLLACKLRVAFSSERGGGVRVGSPATRLGAVCHEVLEAAAKGLFGSPDFPEWTRAFTSAWEAAIARQQDEIAKLGLPRPWSPPERWPFFAQRKVATKRIAREVSREVHAEGFQGSAEDELSSSDGRIRGKPDLIVRSPVHEVRDYKTGSVTNDDGAAREEYAMQVQLYAVLEKETTGSWPTRGVLVPLPGDPVAVDVDPAVARDTADRAATALDTYNAAVDAGQAAGLGSPSPAVCRYCEHAPHCQPFWEVWNDDWPDERAGAAAGTVDVVRKALRGGVSLDLRVEKGIAEAGRLTVHGLDPVAHPVLDLLDSGDSIAIVGLKATSPGHAVPTYQLRLAAAPAAPASV